MGRPRTESRKGHSPRTRGRQAAAQRGGGGHCRGPGLPEEQRASQGASLGRGDAPRGWFMSQRQSKATPHSPATWGAGRGRSHLPAAASPQPALLGAQEPRSQTSSPQAATPHLLGPHILTGSTLQPQDLIVSPSRPLLSSDRNVQKLRAETRVAQGQEPGEKGEWEILSVKPRLNGRSLSSDG